MLNRYGNAQIIQAISLLMTHLWTRSNSCTLDGQSFNQMSQKKTKVTETFSGHGCPPHRICASLQLFLKKFTLAGGLNWGVKFSQKASSGENERITQRIEEELRSTKQGQVTCMQRIGTFATLGSVPPFVDAAAADVLFRHPRSRVPNFDVCVSNFRNSTRSILIIMTVKKSPELTGISCVRIARTRWVFERLLGYRTD